MNKIKKRIYNILETAEKPTLASRTVSYTITGLILISTATVVLETVDVIARGHKDAFELIEWITVGVFSIEYILRIWCCTVDERYRDPIRGRLKYASNFLSIMDLLAVLPFYIPGIIRLDLRILRIFRLFRILRILKLGRYSESLQTFGRIFILKKAELTSSFLIVLLLLLLASSLMYAVEHKYQPELFSSIPATMWWAVSTLTTVGYGDMYPVSGLGKLLGSVIALLGLGMVALPAGILASGFVSELSKRPVNKCPNCGHIL